MNHDDRDNHDDLARSENIWAASETDAGHRIGDAIGPYIIEEELGEGGYGMVYLARQTKPVQRHVALKVLKPGMDSRSIVARFEAERQVLAMMEHPGVAKVFDAGQTDQGRPYFAMEHVPGVPITRYCDEHRLSVPQRLELFILVCEAVQYAHTQGIIHRDLKPGNILVTEVNGRPVVKVIDFGVAKAVLTKHRSETAFTLQGQIIGTPEYMSPEQADVNRLDVDTRSDVYSLGVVLYELLTGLLPFQASEDTGLVEIQRMVREVDPPRLTTRLRSHADAGTFAARRSLEPRSLLQRVRGDLEWIVMKCLDKDRARRYATADALAMDIQRHLQNEPVLAGPPSTVYRMGKFVRRNRALAVAVLAVGVVLLAATVVSVNYAMREAEQRRVAEANELRAIEQTDIAERAAERAMLAEAEAKQMADELRIVADFQRAMLMDIDVHLMGIGIREDVIAATRAWWERMDHEPSDIDRRLHELDILLGGANFTDVALSTLDDGVLARSLTVIETQFEQQPNIQAALFDSVATTYYTLGRYSAALTPRQRSVELNHQLHGPGHIDTLQATYGLGVLHWRLGDIDAARDTLETVIAHGRDSLGDAHPEVLRAVNAHALMLMDAGDLDTARSQLESVLQRRTSELGHHHPDTLESVDALGQVMQRQGQIEEARDMFQQAVDGRERVLGEHDPATLVSLNNLAQTVRELGDWDQAELVLRQLLDVLRSSFGDRHPRTLNAANNLGRVLRDQTQYEEAERYYREALEGFQHIFGPMHPDTLTLFNNYGRVLRALGRMDEAEQYYRLSLEGRSELFGPDHPQTLVAVNNMGFLMRALSRYDEAENYFRRALDGLEHYGEHHPHVARTTSNVALSLFGQSRYDEAEPYYAIAIERFTAAFGENHHETLNAMSNRVLLLQAMERHDEAVEQGAEVVRRTREAQSDQSRHLGFYLMHLGRSLLATEQFSEAEAMFLESHAIHAEVFGPTNTRTTGLASTIADMYVQWHSAEPDAGYDAEASRWRRAE